MPTPPTSPREYDVGATILVTVLFKTSGVLADPTTVTFRVKDPNGNITAKVYPTDPEVTRNSVGSFSYPITLSTPGSWTYRVVGEGAVKGAAERRVQVRWSDFIRLVTGSFSANAVIA